MGRTKDRTNTIAMIVACAMFMAQLDGAVVVLALPSMGHSFGVEPLDVSAGITVYLMVQVVLLPATGWLADHLGSRRVFAWSVALFTMTSVACALSVSLTQFLVARVLQGAAAAVMTSVSRILMLETTPKEHLLRANLISTTSMLVAPTIGPALGGLITTYWSWPWIFLLNVPIGVAGILLALRLIPITHGVLRRPFDARGYLLFTAGLAPMLYASVLLSGNALDWRRSLLYCVIGVVFSTMALRHLRTHPHPIIWLDSVHVDSYRISTLTAGALVRLPVRAMAYVLPLMFQLAFGLSPLISGLLLLALNGGDLLLKALIPRILDAGGYRRTLISASLLMALALLACARFSRAAPIELVAAILAFGGMCRSVLFSGLSTLAFADIPRDRLNSASVLWNIVQQTTNGLAVSLTSVTLSISAFIRHAPGGPAPALPDFDVVLLLMATITVLAAGSFTALRADAGAALGRRSVSTS